MGTNGMNSNIYKYKNLEDFVLDAAQAIEDFVLWQLKEKEEISIALSGGQSPQPVYKVLAKNKKIPWDKVELFMVDERYVPKNSSEANFKMLEETLLSKLPPIKAFYDFNTNLPLEEAAKQYDEMLEKRKGKLFDLVLLGMGSDGHTASLFPKSSALKEKIKLATISQSPDGLGRLTLTYPALLNTERVMFLIQGEEKEKLVEALDLNSKKTSDFPAKMMMKHPHVEIYYYA